jgi:hypothetical protein
VGAQSTLGLDRPACCVARPREREEERVALRVDLGPARLAERLADEPPVVARDLGVAVAQLLQQPRRAFDVGEDEGDRALWERAHGTI